MIDYRIWYLKLVLRPLKRFNIAKTILVSVLKSILRIDFISLRFHVVINTWKCLRWMLFTERGRCWLIHWDLRCFVLFVLMNNYFVSREFAVEVAVVDRKVPKMFRLASNTEWRRRSGHRLSLNIISSLCFVWQIILFTPSTRFSMLNSFVPSGMNLRDFCSRF